MSPRTLEVLVAGPFTTVQDEGRPGLAMWGVGRSGAADRGAAALANRLTANAAGAALLEATMGGLAVRAGTALTVALTGAPVPAVVDGRPVAHCAPVPLAAGTVLELGRPLQGLRTYLAVRGGIEVPAVLGSRSYDVLARLGPPPLAAGDVLPVGPEPRRWPQVDQIPRPGLRGAAVLRLTGPAGPHADALAAQAGLAGVIWSVSGDSDRSGVRLDGAPVPRTDAAEWPVEGVARGAVQLPPSGRPVLMLADHPVTGGYPVIGCLDDVSCDLAGQLRPGDRVRLDLRG